MRRMQLLLVEEDEEEQEGGGEDGVEDHGERILQHMKISLNSFVGLTSNKSFKVEGSIGERSVLILVDNGASGNFLTTQLAKELNLEVQQLPIFTIEVGNGQKERGNGVCCDVRLQVQGVHIIQNFFLMELGGTEVILGMDWLSSLGKIEADFQEMSLKWRKEGKQYEIWGDPALCHTQTSWKAAMKALKEEGEGYLLMPKF